MDALIEAAPWVAGGWIAGTFTALAGVRFRKRVPAIDGAMEVVGIPGVCRIYDDGEHRYDRVITDGRGWKCRCGAKAGKK